jgi:hypothetical protein
MRSRKKQKLTHIEDQGQTLSCGMVKYWPPVEVEVYGDDVESLRYKVPDLLFRRLKTWASVCGVFEMDASKCRKCPHVLVDGVSKPPHPTQKVINSRTLAQWQKTRGVLSGIPKKEGT